MRLEQAIYGDSCQAVAIPSDGSCPICAQIVLQSGAQWGSVAIRSDPRTGVVRFLPPRHSGPKLSAVAPAAAATAPTRKRTPVGVPRPLSAQPRLQGPAHGPGPVPRGARGRCRSLRRPRSLHRDLSDRRVHAVREQVLSELNPLSRKGRMMRRRFHGRSHDETLDSAGRVRIPRHLIDHAGLEEGPCVVIGVADHLEIWNTGAWTEHDAEIDETATEIAEELAGGGPGAG